MIKKFGNIQVEEINSDGYLLWRIELDSASPYKDLGESIGIRRKIIDEAVKRGVKTLVLSIKDPKKEFSIKVDEFLKEAVEDDFVGKYPDSPMKFLYYPVWNK